jgi:hypothetical protein
MNGAAVVRAAFAEITPPTARFVDPGAGDKVRGEVPVRVLASGGSGTGYTYRVTVDGAPVYAGTEPLFAWDTTGTADGVRMLGVTVTDSAGGTSAASRKVTVVNTVAGTLQVKITAPAPRTVLRGVAEVTVWLEGTTGTSNTYTVLLGGKQVASLTTASRGPVRISFPTTVVADGSRLLAVRAQDAAGRTSRKSISVVVRNNS